MLLVNTSAKLPQLGDTQRVTGGAPEKRLEA
jgi:hypothetical protein